jgi:hypothetical protein
MNFWWMQRLSSIHLNPGDTTAGTQAHRGRAQKAVREHSTLSPETRIDVLESHVGHRSVSWKRSSSRCRSGTSARLLTARTRMPR